MLDQTRTETAPSADPHTDLLAQWRETERYFEGREVSPCDPIYGRREEIETALCDTPAQTDAGAVAQIDFMLAMFERFDFSNSEIELLESVRARLNPKLGHQLVAMYRTTRSHMPIEHQLQVQILTLSEGDLRRLILAYLTLGLALPPSTVEAAFDHQSCGPSEPGGSTVTNYRSER